MASFNMSLSASRDASTSLNCGPEVEEFANALDECLSPYLAPSEKRDRILDLPRRYHENALRRLSTKRPKRVRDSHDSMDMDFDDADFGRRSGGDSQDTKKIEKEIQTWDLIRRLLPLRSHHASSDLHLSRDGDDRSPLEDFLLTDSVARQRHAVLQWLQNNAASRPDIDDLVQELQANADRGDIIAHGWLHTRSKIKLRKNMTAWPHLLDRQSTNVAQSHVNGDGAPLVTQLDPDAMTRQGRKLEPQDEYFERAIWLGCFEHLRRGSSSETIRDWCQERTELWRSISVSAMLLPLDGDDALTDAPLESLALWRRMCSALAQKGGSDDYERAVYGILSGDIASVEKVSKKWDDFLFANYNALLRTQIDNYLLSRCTAETVSSLQSFPVLDAVQLHGGNESIEKRLIRSLETQKSIQGEATEPSKALQGSFIANEMNRHLYEQGFMITEEARKAGLSALLRHIGSDVPQVASSKFFNLSQNDGMRVVAHVYILNALVEQMEQEDKQPVQKIPLHWRHAQQSIVAAYTDFLRRANLPELIPLYCSTIDAPRRYEVLSWNLIRETESKQRMLQLKLIKKAGIDVVQFVEAQALLLFEGLGNINEIGFPAKKLFKIVDSGSSKSRQGRPIRADFFGEEEDAIDAKHENMIRALEWLLLVHETWPKVFSVGTMVYKYFLKHMHLNAARQLMERVPFAAVLREVTDDEEELRLDSIAFWKHHLEQSNVLLVEAQEVLVDARNYRELEALVKALDNLETVASLVEISLDTPAVNREFWNKVGDEIKATKENVQPLLQRWLLTSVQDGDEVLNDIREAYLPETILAYISALHFAGTGLSRDNLLECMELSAVIAERNSDLAEVFVKSKRMTELVESFAACSKALAIATGEKRAVGSSSKKLKEMGWSRDLWSVKT